MLVCPDQFMTNAIARIMKIVASAQRTWTSVAPNTRTAAATRTLSVIMVRMPETKSSVPATER